MIIVRTHAAGPVDNSGDRTHVGDDDEIADDSADRPNYYYFARPFLYEHGPTSERTTSTPRVIIVWAEPPTFRDDVSPD